MYCKKLLNNGDRYCKNYIYEDSLCHKHFKKKTPDVVRFDLSKNQTKIVSRWIKTEFNGNLNEEDDRNTRNISSRMLLLMSIMGIATYGVGIFGIFGIKLLFL